MTDEHVCACYGCRPDLFPIHATRQGEFHAASYLGDHHAGLEVTLDGEPLLHCFEAFAGRNGYAVVGSMPAHICLTCGLSDSAFRRPDRGACLTIVRGNVGLRTAVPT